MQKPLTSLMALPSAGIRSPGDLKGKRVGTAGIPYQHAYLQTILAHAGVDPGSVKEINVGFNLVQAMLSKKVDATLGGFWNYEGVHLDAGQEASRDPAHGQARRADLRRADPRRPARDLDTAGASRLRRFLLATAAGYRLLRDDPATGVDPLAEGVTRARQGPADGQRAGHAPGLLPAGQEPAVGLAGLDRLGGLRALDAGEQAAHASAVGVGAADQRVPARGRTGPRTA